MIAYSDAIAHATPCHCGNKKPAGPTSPTVVVCGECGVSGVPAENKDWRQAVLNWNTLPRIGGDKTETPPT